MWYQCIWISGKEYDTEGVPSAIFVKIASPPLGPNNSRVVVVVACCFVVVVLVCNWYYTPPPHTHTLCYNCLYAKDF